MGWHPAAARVLALCLVATWTACEAADAPFDDSTSPADARDTPDTPDIPVFHGDLLPPSDPGGADAPHPDVPDSADPGGPTACLPACDGRACGGDGCLGHCGMCPLDSPFCLEGACTGGACGAPPTAFGTGGRFSGAVIPTDPAVVALACPDQDGDGVGDNGLGPYLAGILGEGAIAWPLQTRLLSLSTAWEGGDAEGMSLDLLQGTTVSGDWKVDAESFAPDCRAVARWDGVSVAGGGLRAGPGDLSLGDVAQAARPTAYLFPGTLLRARLEGTVALEDGGLRMDDGVLSGVVTEEEVQVLGERFRHACQSGTPPSDCSDNAGLFELFIRSAFDLDRDGDGSLDAASACLFFTVVPARFWVEPPPPPPPECDAGPEAADMPVPAGPAYVGCNPARNGGDCRDWQVPYHPVTVPAFTIDRTEVTNAAYSACVDAGACAPMDGGEYCWSRDPARETRPVACATWEEAAAYCVFEGKRLCSETEWEKAARGGCEFYDDCAIESISRPWELAFPQQRSAPCPFSSMSPCPVGCAPNGSPYGVRDLGGDVAEWVLDAVHPDFVGAPADGSSWEWPAGTELPPSESLRVRKLRDVDDRDIGNTSTGKYGRTAAIRCCASAAGDPCVPRCEAGQCGPDGCGGLCGTCPAGEVCHGTVCARPPGGCGDGVCDPGETDCSCWVDCALEGSCCLHAADSRTCGWCAWAQEPRCADRECGVDAFGIACGDCPSGRTCSDGQCVAGGCDGPCGDIVAIPGGRHWHSTWDFPTDVPPFEIDRTEVTVDRYAACVQAGACGAPGSGLSDCNWERPGRGDHPVNCVTWDQARTFCQWAGMRLCSSAEWDKAAVGGCERHSLCPLQTPFNPAWPWGGAKADCSLAVMNDGCGAGGTLPAGSRLAGASPYGVLDMAGNVAEWVQDWVNLYGTGQPPADGAPRSPAATACGTSSELWAWSESDRRVRGGGFRDAKLAWEGGAPAIGEYGSAWDADRGFRCCRTLDADPPSPPPDPPPGDPTPATGLFGAWNEDCYADGWCRQGPLAGGRPVRQVWAGAPDDVWISGDEGLLLHWDGADWHRLKTGTVESVWARGVGGGTLWVSAGPRLFRRDGAQWSSVLESAGQPFGPVAGSGPSDVWVRLGASGLLHWDGVAWSEVPLPRKERLAEIAAAVPGEVWLASGGYYGGVRMRWKGSWERWADADRLWRDLWVAGSDDVWVVGTVTERWNGTAWESMGGGNFNALWGAGPADVWAVQDLGDLPIDLFHWDGSSWTPQGFAMDGYGESLDDLAGSGTSDVWAVGNPLLLRWDGARWAEAPGTTGKPLRAVSGVDATEAWAVGGGPPDGDVMVRWDGTRWTPERYGVDAVLHDIAMAPDGTGWAVGDHGAILRHSGGAWEAVASPVDASLKAVATLPDGTAWAAGVASNKSVVLRWDGSAWVDASQGLDVPPAGDRTVRDIWATGPDDVFALRQSGQVYRWDGASWTALPALPVQARVLWASGPGDLWAAGARVFRWDGVAWTEQAAFGPLPTYGNAIWGTGPNDVWIAGESYLTAVMRHWNGAGWTETRIERSGPLHGIWGIGAHVWAVGEKGSILHRRAP